MAEDEVVDGEQPADDDAEIDAEVASLTADDPVKPASQKLRDAVVNKERANRELKRQLKAEQARNERTNSVLTNAAPYFRAIENNPKLKADLLRSVDGTRQSAETTEQPDDPDAAEYAEVLNLYLPDGVTLDVARGQRLMKIHDRRSGKQAQDAVRPLAGATLAQRADANYARVLAMTDDDGAPLASEESLREVWSTLDPSLLADPKIVDVVLENAIGRDARRGRKPKAPIEPLYLERAGGRRGADGLTNDDRARAKSHGVSEKEMSRVVASLASGKPFMLED